MSSRGFVNKCPRATTTVRQHLIGALLRKCLGICLNEHSDICNLDKSKNVFYVMKSRLLLSIIVVLIAGFSSTFGQNYDTNNPVVQTFVGSGFYGYLDGQGTQTMFNNPVAVVADSSSNLFVLDTGNGRIR